MYRLRPNYRIRRPTLEVCGRFARGLTFAELVIAMALTSMLSLVLGGLLLAGQAAREHSTGLEEATSQANATIERIQYMVSQAGVYQTSGQPTTLGLAVVNHTWSIYYLPDVLVIWSGGQTGDMAPAGVQERLPLVSELVIYSLDPDDTQRLVELTVPSDSSTIDFRDAGFASRVLGLLQSPNAEKVVICDRIRVSHLSAGGSPDADFGNVRFDLKSTPSDADLAATTAGTAWWVNLDWSQGIVSSDSGLRQSNLRIEMQVDRYSYEQPGTELKTIAIPFFGSANYRYVYQP